MGIVSAQPEAGPTPAARLLTKAALVGDSPQIPTATPAWRRSGGSTWTAAGS